MNVFNRILLLERDSTQKSRPKGTTQTRNLFICISEKSRGTAGSRAQNYYHVVLSSPSLSSVCFFVGFILWQGLPFCWQDNLPPHTHSQCFRFRFQVSGLNPSSTFAGQMNVHSSSNSCLLRECLFSIDSLIIRMPLSEAGTVDVILKTVCFFFFLRVDKSQIAQCNYIPYKVFWPSAFSLATYFGQS